MFQDPEYVKWANEKTVHVLSYSVDEKEEKPEPVVSVKRGDETVEVLAMYPMFTPNEADLLVREVNAAFKFPTSTPWAGVIASDGKTVLAFLAKRATSKEFEDLYETEQKKLTGPVLSKADWSKIRTSLTDSTTAEFDDRWPEAVAAAVAANAVQKDVPLPLRESLEARLASLRAARDSRSEAAAKEKDAAKRAAALAKVAKDFEGLPEAGQPKSPPTPPTPAK